MRRVQGFVLFWLLLAWVPAAGGVDSRLEVVQALGKAFNAHDVDAMLRHVTDDVEWLSIQGAAISVEARGKTALRDGMKSYFEALPSARSTIESPLVSGKYVVVRERTFWKRDGVEKSQSSLAVYEIEEGLVKRVWYFPVEE